jgi:predicted nuclease of predicted toxin-antitoxin system
MNNLRLIADVHISPLTVAELKAKGYDIVRTTDLLPATASDTKILEIARLENRIVITQDLDFSMLIALGKYDQPSLIISRVNSPPLGAHEKSKKELQYPAACGGAVYLLCVYPLLNLH